jgi:hypothetical protein
LKAKTCDDDFVLGVFRCEVTIEMACVSFQLLGKVKLSSISWGACVFKRTLPWAFVLLLIGPTAAFSANFNAATTKGISQAYGFVLGQDYTLARIAEEIPELSLNVELARSQFGATFPNIKVKLESQLKVALGQKVFEALAKTTQIKIYDALSKPKITRQDAIAFFDEIKARSKGDIESPVLEYLLFVNYMSSPVGEFADGFRQRYQTDGTGKAQGVKLKLQLPRSWTAKDGERPHIVRKWLSPNGAGLEMIHLDIRDGGGYSPTKKEMEDFVKSGEVKESVADGATYMASGNFSLEKQTGFWIQSASAVDRAGTKVYQESVMYQLFFNGKAIGIMCTAGGTDVEKTKTSEVFKRLKPLCQQVVNSLVLLQAY